METIVVDHLTKDYGHGRGAFDITLAIAHGTCYGFLGPNGAGKTTVIRHLMGFSKPDSGSAAILGQDCWKHSAHLQATIGYLPGEVTLPEGMTGSAFLAMMRKMRKSTTDRTAELLDLFELDPNISIKQMSLGVKRKLAVVAAFAHDPDILILDEPTSGLDPVMQHAFIDFVQAEKQRGKTIFLSSHIFSEVDAVCDRIGIIKDGHIVSEFFEGELKDAGTKTYRIVFANADAYQTFLAAGFNVIGKSESSLRVRVKVETAQVQTLVALLSTLDVADFTEIPFTLEDYFMGFYETDKDFAEVEQ